MGKVRRTSVSSKVAENPFCGVMRSFFLLGLAGCAVFLLSKTSPDAGNPSVDGERRIFSLRQRHAAEGSEKGRTFTLNLASLNDGKTGEVTLLTHPEWSPIGVAHFHALMDMGYYKDTKFFRVVPDFIVQWGIAADPKKFPNTDKPIKDDKVVTTNARGTLTFATAGPNTRTTQLFVNTRKGGNAFLDKQGFSPFAEVINGMELIDEIYGGYGEDPDQGLIEKEGNAYLDKNFPKLSYIADTKTMEQDDGTTEDGNE